MNGPELAEFMTSCAAEARKAPGAMTTGAAGAISVTFREPGSLGMKLTPDAGVVLVKALNPGTQATRHVELRPGLRLLAVGGTSVAGMSYDETIEVIKAAGRPVTCQFSSEAEPEPEPEPELDGPRESPVLPLQLRQSPAARSTPLQQSVTLGSVDFEVEEITAVTLHPVTRKMLAAEGWEEYGTMLQEGGYGDIAALMDADADDLKELGIKTGHAKRLLKMLGRSPGAMLAREGSRDFEDTAEGEKRPVVVPAESESEEGSSEEGSSEEESGSDEDDDDDVSGDDDDEEEKEEGTIPATEKPEWVQKPVEPLQLRHTPRTPSDDRQSSLASPLPPPSLLPPRQVSVKLKHDPKHGYGVDVSDDGTVTSLRAAAVGKVAVGSRLASVDGRLVGSKRQILNALTQVDISLGAAVAFVFHQPGKGKGKQEQEQEQEQEGAARGRQQAAAAPDQAAAPVLWSPSVTVSDQSESPPNLPQATTPDGVTVAHLRRDLKHGFGLDVDDDCVVRSLRAAAVGSVALGARLVSVAGRPVQSKRDIALALTQLVPSGTTTVVVPFAFRPAAQAPTVTVLLRRDLKCGYGLDLSDSALVLSVRAGAVDKVSPGWQLLSVGGCAVGSKREVARALAGVDPDAGAVAFDFRRGDDVAVATQPQGPERQGKPDAALVQAEAPASTAGFGAGRARQPTRTVGLAAADRCVWVRRRDRAVLLRFTHGVRRGALGCARRLACAC